MVVKISEVPKASRVGELLYHHMKVLAVQKMNEATHQSIPSPRRNLVCVHLYSPQKRKKSPGAHIFAPLFRPIYKSWDIQLSSTLWWLPLKPEHVNQKHQLSWQICSVIPRFGVSHETSPAYSGHSLASALVLVPRPTCWFQDLRQVLEPGTRTVRLHKMQPRARGSKMFTAPTASATWWVETIWSQPKIKDVKATYHGRKS